MSYYIVVDANKKAILNKNGEVQLSRSMQLTEFLAHMNEVYWGGNEVWELFDQKFYNDVKTIMRVVYRGKKDALN